MSADRPTYNPPTNPQTPNWSNNDRHDFLRDGKESRVLSDSSFGRPGNIRSSFGVLSARTNAGGSRSEFSREANESRTATGSGRSYGDFRTSPIYRLNQLNPPRTQCGVRRAPFMHTEGAARAVVAIVIIAVSVVAFDMWHATEPLWQHVLRVMGGAN